MRRLLWTSRSRAWQFLRSTSGQFSVEASLTMPVILLATLLLIFMALFVYHQAGLYHSASLTVSRTADHWGNSHKDPVTGAAAQGQHDSLYWRLTGDQITSLFAFMVPASPARVALPTGSGSGGSGPEGKLSRAAGVLPEGLQGELTYEHAGLLRTVGAEVSGASSLPSYAKSLWGDPPLSASVRSFVVDPAELIRLTDLTRTFIAEIQGRIKPKAAIAAMVDPAAAPAEAAKISSHKEASAYLRTLVTGTEQVIEVDPQTKRTIDALDAGGVAHQAYYTFNEKNLREVQMPKDEALLKQGTQVQGVVWHFFKLSKADKVKLSKGLKAELERRGIVVVLHE